MLNFQRLALLTFLGCSEEKNEASGLSLSAETLAFGEVPLDTSSAETFQVTNQNTYDVDILSVSLVSLDSSVWEISRGSDTVLSKGESLDVEVEFTPVNLDLETGRIQIRTTDESQPLLYVEVTAESTPSNIDGDGDGLSPAEGDCDDDNPTVYPGAEELCDALDNDCNGEIPVEESDEDYDGVLVCSGDCDDDDDDVYPGAPEICDAKDSDCDGVVQDEMDEDGDGYDLCAADCDDAEPNSFPGNDEICDGLDNNCTGEIDDIDEDGDGYSPCSLGGDCQDNNPDAHPVVLDITATSNGNGTIDAPYSDLQTALANLDSVCRTVALLPGTYNFALNWLEGDVEFQGLGLSNSDVVLDGGGSDRLFDVSGGASLRLTNLTVQNGVSDADGGAIRAITGSVFAENVLFANNQSTGGDGGAISVSSGVLQLINSQFEGNSSVDDGGAIAVLTGEFDDLNSIYTNNAGVRGGAVLLDSTAILINGSHFEGNSADEQGGALAISSGDQLDISRSVFWLNSSILGGGAVSIVNHQGPNSVFRNNRVQDNLTSATGAGLSITGFASSFLVANNSFAANQSANGHGAGIYASASDSSGLFIWSNLFLFQNGDSAVFVDDDIYASVAYNTSFLTTSQNAFDLGLNSGDYSNNVEDPLIVEFTNDADPTNDDLSPTTGSPLIDSGPTSSSANGPTYADWIDLNGTQNDRGHTGGQGQ